jgi:UTP-glucose-1-phosphate uridylyltransferase
MKTLIIPCAGKGERMSEHFFPKPLLPLEQRPILFQIMDFWNDKINQVVIVINNYNGQIIKEYVEKYYDKNIKIDFCVQEKSNGTYFAIKNALNFANNKELILNWSDVLLCGNVDQFTNSEKNQIFLTDKSECRWNMIDGKFVHDKENQYKENGIYGVFLINDKDSFLSELTPQEESEIEILESFDESQFEGVKFENFYDVGDDTKYSSDLRKVNENSGVRAFGSSNKMKIKDDVIVKYTQDKKLREGEENWYKNANFSFTPEVISYSPLTLKRLNAITAHDKLASNPTEEMEELIISEQFRIIKELHLSKEPVESDFDSSFDQYYAKTIKRLERVNFMFDSFNEEKIKINGKLYSNPLTVLRENEDKIKDIFVKKFRFIHGDPQLSNTLMDNDNNLYLIDPRGYFGSRDLYGDPLYDFAKMYYGICGMYGSFCKGVSKFELTNDGFEITPLLENEIYSRRRETFIKQFNELGYVEGDMNSIDILHAIIWLSVTDYTANDVLSCMYAYLKGTILINECFN